MTRLAEIFFSEYGTSKNILGKLGFAESAPFSQKRLLSSKTWRLKWMTKGLHT